jgi:hypothetical protein
MPAEVTSGLAAEPLVDISARVPERSDVTLALVIERQLS